MTSKAAKVGLFKDGDLRNFDDLKVIDDLKNASSDGFPMSMLASTPSSPKWPKWPKLRSQPMARSGFAKCSPPSIAAWESIRSISARKSPVPLFTA
jgi:hypothetical protein